MRSTSFHITASLWLIYGLHTGNTIASVIGVLWTVVYIGAEIFGVHDLDLSLPSRRADKVRSDYWN